MPAKRPSTWPVGGLTTGQSALAAGVHCPVVLTTRSTIAYALFAEESKVWFTEGGAHEDK